MEETTQGGKTFRRIAAAGAWSAALAVGAGAFGAHGLRTVLPPEMIAVFETGVRYQMYHAFALVGAGIAGISGAGPDRRLLLLASWAFGLGSVLFSGSLYALALTGLGALGAVTPAGGLAFIAGWGMFGAAFLRSGRG